jgi:hypothetical protein
MLAFFLYRLTVLKKNGITSGLTIFLGGLLFYFLISQRALVMVYFGLGGYTSDYVPFSELVLQVIGEGIIFLAISTLAFQLYQEATLPRKRKISPIVDKATQAMASITKPTKVRINTDIYRVYVEELKDDGAKTPDQVD